MGWTGRTGWDGTVIKMKRVFPVASSGHLKSVWNVILDVNPLVIFKKKKKAHINSPPKKL